MGNVPAKLTGKYQSYDINSPHHLTPAPTLRKHTSIGTNNGGGQRRSNSNGAQQPMTSSPVPPLSTQEQQLDLDFQQLQFEQHGHSGQLAQKQQQKRSRNDYIDFMDDEEEGENEDEDDDEEEEEEEEEKKEHIQDKNGVVVGAEEEEEEEGERTRPNNSNGDRSTINDEEFNSRTSSSINTESSPTNSSSNNNNNLHYSQNHQNQLPSGYPYGIIQSGLVQASTEKRNDDDDDDHDHEHFDEQAVDVSGLEEQLEEENGEENEANKVDEQIPDREEENDNVIEEKTEELEQQVSGSGSGFGDDGAEMTQFKLEQFIADYNNNSRLNEIPIDVIEDVGGDDKNQKDCNDIENDDELVKQKIENYLRNNKDEDEEADGICDDPTTVLQPTSATETAMQELPTQAQSTPQKEIDLIY